MRRSLHSLLLGASLFTLPASLSAQSAKDPAAQALEREILKQLIEINTSDSAGHTAEAARAMADRLLVAGFPEADVRVPLQSPPTEPGGALPGTARRQEAHPVDVAPGRGGCQAKTDHRPVPFVEKDGFYYAAARLTSRTAARLVANFIRYKKEGFVPDRDLIIVLTADEETSGESIRWLLAEHRELVDAEYALNTDGGGGDYRDGKPIRFNVQAAEKVYQSFSLEVRNKGGHSSRPVPDNAIYRLARVGPDRGVSVSSAAQ
jgi:acetylornithine deacetylase/succinyl-diaminopimelate desuccinylase-like protein